MITRWLHQVLGEKMINSNRNKSDFYLYDEKHTIEMDTGFKQVDLKKSWITSKNEC